MPLLCILLLSRMKYFPYEGYFLYLFINNNNNNKIAIWKSWYRYADLTTELTDTCYIMHVMILTRYCLLESKEPLLLYIRRKSVLRKRDKQITQIVVWRSCNLVSSCVCVCKLYLSTGSCFGQFSSFLKFGPYKCSWNEMSKNLLVKRPYPLDYFNWNFSKCLRTYDKMLLVNDPHLLLFSVH